MGIGEFRGESKRRGGTHDVEREGLEDGGGGGGGWLLEGGLVEVVAAASLLEDALEDVVVHRPKERDFGGRGEEKGNQREGEEVQILESNCCFRRWWVGSVTSFRLLGLSDISGRK